jgi:RNA polymerase sigma-70 factor (ECF subfamily)
MDTRQFEQYRPLLFSIAYRMLGTVADAEDMLQEAYLRVRDQAAETIQQPKAYLTTVVTRLCLNQLELARTKREQYLGPWLPEPILTDHHPDLVNPQAAMMQSDSISTAFLVLLERLSPAERAAFLLHDIFGYRFKEIADILDKSEAACRQLCRRAKAHLTAHRPRFEADPDQHRRLLNSFFSVIEAGDIEDFLQFLADDVTLVTDGGGERGAATRVLHGSASVVAFIQGIYRLAGQGLNYEVTNLNGQPAILGRTENGQPRFALFVYGESGRVKLMHVIGGQKLAALNPTA